MTDPHQISVLQQARYRAYAAARGMTPDQMYAHEQESFRGYIDWITARWNEWRELAGPHAEDQAAFETWLMTRSRESESATPDKQTPKLPPLVRDGVLVRPLPPFTGSNFEPCTLEECAQEVLYQRGAARDMSLTIALLRHALLDRGVSHQEIRAIEERGRAARGHGTASDQRDRAEHEER